MDTDLVTMWSNVEAYEKEYFFVSFFLFWDAWRWKDRRFCKGKTCRNSHNAVTEMQKYIRNGYETEGSTQKWIVN